MNKITIFNAFDIETFVNEKNLLVPYCICTILNSNSQVFYGLNCVSDFLNFLLTFNNKILYAHNLTFDGSFIIKELSAKKIKFEVFIFNNQLYYIKIEEKKIELKCSLMLFPYSLNKCQKILNGNKKEYFNHRQINDSNINDNIIKKNIIFYCMNDVKLVLEILTFYNNALIPLYKK